MIGIETKALPATNTKPRRIVAFTCNGHRLIVPFDDNCTDVQAHFSAAQELIRAQFKHAPDASTMTYGGTQRGYFFCWPQSTISTEWTCKHCGREYSRAEYDPSQSCASDDCPSHD